MRNVIFEIIKNLNHWDDLEKTHIEFAKEWIESGAELFRIAKPSTPNPHLVSYFVIIDPLRKKILLTDHKKANLWLPSGGHVEIDEHPKETVVREAIEELQLQADFLLHDPLFLSVSETVGANKHHDISLWYVLQADSGQPLCYDEEEFHGIRWFDMNAIPYGRSDPHMSRFVNKLLRTLSGQAVHI